MRLDLFLKQSRLCPRRTLAQELCNAGMVAVNGIPAKPSHSINQGDELTIQHPTRRTTVRVLKIPLTRQTSRKEANDLYEVLNTEYLDRE